jgi:hypothetical protein
VRYERSYLLVVRDDGFEEVFEPFVTARVILSRDLEEQFFDLVKAAERMPRDGVREARAQHYELMLALALGRADSTADRVVKTPELALGAGIHIAHAADNAVGLVVQVQAIGDQFFQLDFGEGIEARTVAIAATAGTPVATTVTAALTTISTGPATATGSTARPAFATGSATTGRTAFTRRAIPRIAALLLRFRLFFCHFC